MRIVTGGGKFNYNFHLPRENVKNPVCARKMGGGTYQPLQYIYSTRIMSNMPRPYSIFVFYKYYRCDETGIFFTSDLNVFRLYLSETLKHIRFTIDKLAQ